MSHAGNLYLANQDIAIATERFSLPNWAFTAEAVVLRRRADNEPVDGRPVRDEVGRIHHDLKFGDDGAQAAGILGIAHHVSSGTEFGYAGYAYAFERQTGSGLKVVLGGVCVERFLRGNGISAMLARDALSEFDPDMEVDNLNNAVNLLLNHGFEEVDGRRTSAPAAEVCPEALTVRGILAALPEAFPALKTAEYNS